MERPCSRPEITLDRCSITSLLMPHERSTLSWIKAAFTIMRKVVSRRQQSGLVRGTGGSENCGPINEVGSDGSRSIGGKPQFSALELEAKLWGGFARYAVPALEEIENDPLAYPDERRKAAWSLTRWFYVEEAYERALHHIAFEKRLSEAPQGHFTLAEAQCLVKLRRWKAADAVLEKGALLHERVDFKLLRSTVVRHRERERGRSDDQADMAQLNLLNHLYISAGLSPLQKIRSQDPLHLSNITALARPRREHQALKVSVIVPAYNAGATLNWAVASLLQQSWHNLEIIIVDDCSADDTCEVAEKISAQDGRVRLVRLKENNGTYAARNAGLRYAVGDLITVHDSDDWSHPQRIESQIDLLESKPGIMATRSHWVRVSEGLDVIGSWIPKGSLVDLNFSSLLFRREILAELGTWDEVMVSGDTEFYARLKQVYGKSAVMELPRTQLLAFSLTRDDSLTRSEATHLRSLYYGLRANYRDSYRYWHSQLSPGSKDLPFDPAKARRRFPVPPRNRPTGKRSSRTYDVIVISDFAVQGRTFVSTINYVIAACKADKRTAVFHWRRFDLAADAARQPHFYEVCMDFDIDILGPGDVAETDLVLIGCPSILQHKIEPMPEIRTKRLIVNGPSNRLVDGCDQRYDLLRARANLRIIFGTDGVWMPIRPSAMDLAASGKQ